MAYYVYILHSPTLDKYYTGQSQYRHKRARQHRQASRSTWTSQARDWVEVYAVKVEDRSEATTLERRIKKRGAKRFLLDRGLIGFPQSRNDLTE